MIIVNPNNTTHTISIVSRYDVSESSDVIVDIKDSFKGESTDVENTFIIEKGKLSITFDYDFRNEDRYELAISNEDNAEVAYRGIILATTQGTQEYKLTNDKYYY
tara:strand:- start:453 stop:767 length:315 start_codon:yes stop_codon:yes gene_type:complete